MSKEKVHLAHCYEGENKDGCKYGATDCPAEYRESFSYERDNQWYVTTYGDRFLLSYDDYAGMSNAVGSCKNKAMADMVVKFIHRAEDMGNLIQTLKIIHDTVDDTLVKSMLSDVIKHYGV